MDKFQCPGDTLSAAALSHGLIPGVRASISGKPGFSPVHEALELSSRKKQGDRQKLVLKFPAGMAFEKASEWHYPFVKTPLKILPTVAG